MTADALVCVATCLPAATKQQERHMTSGLLCVLWLPLLVTRVASLATPPPVLDRIGARSRLLGLLGPSAGAGVVPLAGELVGLVQELGLA